MNRIKKIADKLQENYHFTFNINPHKFLDILIAAKLAQNSTDKAAYKAYQELQNKIGSWYKVKDTRRIKIENCIRVCGLAQQKSSDIKSLLVSLYKKYNTLELTFLPNLGTEEIYNIFLSHKGFGIKTISCALAFALGRDVFPVDTHVHRVLNRLGLASTAAAEATHKYIKDKIPKGRAAEFHNNLIKFGRNICKAPKPLCGKCFLFELCEFEHKEEFAILDLNVKKENNFIILEAV